MKSTHSSFTALAMFLGESLFSTLIESELQSKIAKTLTPYIAVYVSLLRARAEGE